MSASETGNVSVTSRFGEQDVYLFKEGSHSRLRDVLGSHPITVDGIDGTLFAVCAPNAERVSVISDFNAWDTDRHYLHLRNDASGVWEGFVTGIGHGDNCKYHIVSRHNDYQADKGGLIAIAWLSCQEHQEIFLIQRNKSSDWADIMPRSGFVLYSDALWYLVKRLYRLPHADTTREHLNCLFHPFGRGPYPLRVTCTPIRRDDPFWRTYMGQHRQNLEHLYHNGGIWPFVGDFCVLAVRRGQPLNRSSVGLR